MRTPPRVIGAPALILSGLLAALLAGCSSGGSYDSMSTASLRPQEGMQRNTPRRYPDGSTNSGAYSDNTTYGRAYAEPQRRYVDPGQPTPRDMAAYDNRDRNYARPSAIETASIGSEPNYDQNARWQQPPSSITTGSRAPVTQNAPGPVPSGYYARPPQQTAALGPQVVTVREGDTLYALSRRHNVPMSELMAANRLPNERIAIGQQIVIPAQR